MAENYKGHRIGSRKATVRREFDENGLDAALDIGAKLGLAVGTIKSWAGGWKKGTIPSTTVKPKGKSKYSEVKLDTVLHNKRRNVHLAGHPDYKGVVLEEGPEQCIVRWSNGNEVVACTSWLEDD